MKPLHQLLPDRTTLFRGFASSYVNRGHSRFLSEAQTDASSASAEREQSLPTRNYAPLRLKKWSRTEQSSSSVPTAQSSGIISHALKRRANSHAVSWGEQISYFQTMKHKAS